MSTFHNVEGCISAAIEMQIDINNEIQRGKVYHNCHTYVKVVHHPAFYALQYNSLVGTNILLKFYSIYPRYRCYILYGSLINTQVCRPCSNYVLYSPTSYVVFFECTEDCAFRCLIHCRQFKFLMCVKF